MNDEAYRRYVQINLPHSRTIVARLGRTLEALGAFGGQRDGRASALQDAHDALEAAVRHFDEDPPMDQALRSADAVADFARALVEIIRAGTCRNDRLGQWVRNLFECLGLADERACLSVDCGERPDSPLR